MKCPFCKDNSLMLKNYLNYEYRYKFEKNFYDIIIPEIEILFCEKCNKDYTYKNKKLNFLIKLF